MAKERKTETVSGPEAVAYVLAAARLEGFSFSPAKLEQWSKLGRGELTTEELRRQVLAQLERLRQKDGEGDV